MFCSKCGTMITGSKCLLCDGDFSKKNNNAPKAMIKESHRVGWESAADGRYGRGFSTACKNYAIGVISAKTLAKERKLQIYLLKKLTTREVERLLKLHRELSPRGIVNWLGIKSSPRKYSQIVRAILDNSKHAEKIQRFEGDKRPRTFAYFRYVK